MTAVPRLILPLADWPEEDRDAWGRLFDEGDLFEEGPGIHWSAGGRAKRRQGYGRWLAFLRATNPDLLVAAPQERIRPEIVERFINCELERLKPVSVVSELDDLFAFARMTAPDADWNWLLRALKRLRKKYGPFGLKPRQPLSAGDIFRWALRRMKAVDGNASLSLLRQAIHYRQALMIALLASRPVRSRAFIAIRIGHQLKATDGGYRLDFASSDMKDKRPHSYPLPEKLVGPMLAYLDRFRPVLLRGNDADALWISQNGEPLTQWGFTKELAKITQHHLGVALRPYAFRHIAATSIAEARPDQVGIIREVLGHSTLLTAEKHYNRARTLEACNGLQSIVLQDLREARKIERAKRQGRRGRGQEREA